MLRCQDSIQKGQEAQFTKDAAERLEHKIDRLGQSLKKLEQQGSGLPVNTLDSVIKKQLNRLGKKRVL